MAAVTPTDEDDLFQGSTMTFGEHLEELRTCLIRGAVGLVIGVIIGFFVARPVVHLIEAPLRRALGDYYISRGLEAFDAWRPRREGGPGLPYSRAEVVDAVERHGLSFDLREVHPGRLPGGQESPFDEKEFDLDALEPILLWQPLARDSRVSITTLSAQEAFGIYVKAALLVGFVLAGPWILYQLWTFVAAGLYPHEKRLVHLFLPVSTGLFLAGVGLAFFFVFDFVLAYLLAFNEWLGLDPDPRISEWLGFVLILPIGFGLGFQLPLVMVFLDRLGIVEAETFTSQWRMALVVICIAAAILTPADPYSMLFLATPLAALYFGGIGLCRYTNAKQ
ncbi:MAG: twin-arginine translocase subunit TatC [Planctomycetia bacterium]|jgi:sec-independent protein translocase protein TatC|nr:twin-arginine translocase subunit TatC [Planctomycetia bacterium]